MNEKNNKSLIQYVAIFLILAASSGFYFRTLSQTMCYIVILFAALMLIVAKGKLVLGQKTVFVVLVLVALGMIASLLNGDSYEYVLLPAISLVVGLLVVSTMEYNVFKSRYVNVMVCMSIVSIAAEIVYIIFPQIIGLFPLVHNNAGGAAYNLLITTVGYNFGQGYRIQGVFWEPGAFQVFVSLALFILCKNKSLFGKGFRIKLIVLIIAMIMTFSTTAYLMLMLFLVWYMIENKKYSAMAIIAVAGLIIIPLVIAYVPSVNQIYNTVIKDKFYAFFEAFSGNSTNVSSQVRADAIVYPLKLFGENPILGAGYSGLLGLRDVMGHSMTTCTPINYFATYGIIYGVITVWLFYNLARLFSQQKRTCLWVFIMLLVMLATEDFNGNVCLNIFMLYGVSNKLSSKRKI